MVHLNFFWFPALLAICTAGCNNPSEPVSVVAAKETHRPLIHFTPPEKWMNDPNGLVYHNGTYHLFYQYYPDSTVWGPMHWGHATSPDLVHWKHKPVALYPDSLGWIFSGSAVVDEKNTSGFAPAGDTALVAIFTHHGHDSSVNKKEVQSIAYSLDDGETWIKYAGNPVLPNPGVSDFRDPKVLWYEKENKWVMTLAVKDRVEFYTSPNLKTWVKSGSFGAGQGAHGGVWECPDLIPFYHNGKWVWVLIVNMNPGGPNGGSATQYFVGDFDGATFMANHSDIRWLDYGPDEYAGVTWSHTGNRTILVGWMSNWLYADKVPTLTWRSAMTLPRELRLQEINGQMYVANMPVAETESLYVAETPWPGIETGSPSNQAMVNITLPITIDLETAAADDLAITFSNEEGEYLVAGYNKASNQYYIDRTSAGDSSFFKGFATRHYAPRLSLKTGSNIKLILDVSSIELFADDGLSTMTSLFFPSKIFNTATLAGKVKKGSIKQMKPAW